MSWKAAQTSSQWSRSAGSRSSSAAMTTSALGQQAEELAEAVDREQLGDVGAALLVLQRGDLGELAVLGGELRRGRDLDALRLAERALGEGGEPAQRLDLDVEQLDADGALLRGGVDVEQAAADRELAAVLDLVDALVAGGGELEHRLVEVEQLADLDQEAVRAQLRVGDLLGQRDGGDDDDRCLLAGGLALAGIIRVEPATPRPDRCGGGARCDS